MAEVTERAAIPIPIGTNEVEVEWLVKTICLRAKEALWTVRINAELHPGNLRELLLLSLNAASKRGGREERERCLQALEKHFDGDGSYPAIRQAIEAPDEAPDLAAAIAAVRRESEAWDNTDREPAWADRSFALARHKDNLRFARRVLEALAEDPTPEMIEAGGTCDGVLHIDGEECTIFPAVVWRAMRAALLARAGGDHD